MKLFIEESTLTDIGDAVRDKGGTSELIPVPSLADAIRNLPSGGGGGDVEPVVLTGVQQYACSGALAGAYITLFSNTISTRDITDTTYMFKDSTLKKVPFAINMDVSSYRNMPYMFRGAQLTELPAIPQAYPNAMPEFCRDCNYLRNIPEDYFDNWNFSRIQSNAYCDSGSVFRGCTSLRNAPEHFLKNLPGIQTSNSYSAYAYLFRYCYALDEVRGLGIQNAKITSNCFRDTFLDCSRVKDIIFRTNEDGTPITANWSNQAISLTSNVGYAPMRDYIISNNSGITADKEVTDDASYEALKNDPDWFTLNFRYSRYNHDSAVNTINSLPDCSSGTSNTITFTGVAGSSTDGGAINTLTEAEIAVAAAKGWTVTLS